MIILDLPHCLWGKIEWLSVSDHIQRPTYTSNTDFHEIGFFILFTSACHLERQCFKS